MKKQSPRSFDFLSGHTYEEGSESIVAIMRRRRILLTGFVARMEDTRLPKCVMLGELVRNAGCVGDNKKSRWDVSWTTSELSASTPTSGLLQPRIRGNDARRRNRAGTFHGDMTAAEKVRAGLRHAVV